MRPDRQAMAEGTVSTTLTIVVGVAINLVTGDHLLTGGVALVMGGVLTVWWTSRLASRRAEADAGDGRLEKAALMLAAAVSARWHDEAGRRSLLGSHPLNVRWGRVGAEADAGADLATVFAGAQRLVVLGESGAGKSVQAILLTCALLDSPAPGRPIPVLLSLARWNPVRQQLWPWVERRIVEDYRMSEETVRELVGSGQVIPFLDGLDELPAGLRTPALREIGAAVGQNRPFLLTSRTAEYQRTPYLLTGTVVVRLEPILVDDAADFLTRDESPGATRWQDLLGTFATGGTPLAAALSRPLLLDLMRTVYLTGERDPAELSDRQVFATVADIEHHLLRWYLRTVYEPRAPRPDERWRPGRYLYQRPAEAERWLAFLARRLDNPARQGMAWWRLPAAVPGQGYGTAIGVSTAGLVSVLLVVLGGAPDGVVLALLWGPVAGIAAGVAGQQAVAHLPVEQPRAFTPVRPETAVTGTTWRFGLAFGAPAAVAGLLNFADGPVMGFMTISIICAAAAGLGLALAFGAPVTLASAASPSSVLRRDRATALVTAVPAALLVSLVFWTGVGPRVGVACGVGVLLARMSCGAYGGFVHARWWLAARGRTPLSLMTFLDDAHRRGVLRQAGAVYEFRHDALRRYLLSSGTGGRRARHSAHVP
ncbi:NACHT domain-containing protein [Actinoplanes subglobosus]|uniref:NACHT domain-containing protein n=1 Tax=Actinoplanes subglobosus TaxID=1547892 RepID=A0ABV8IZC2_9ACTN